MNYSQRDRKKIVRKKGKNRSNNRRIIIYQRLHWKINRLIKYAIKINVNSKKIMLTDGNNIGLKK